MAPVTKTEYSTFTYLVTSVRPDGNTLVETDIVVSSNIVTSTPGSGVEPTPSLPQLVSITDSIRDKLSQTWNGQQIILMVMTMCDQ